MTAPLELLQRNGEWTLAYGDTSYSFGTPATTVFNRTTPDVGDVDLRVADVDRARMDGRAFGVDFRSSRTISFDLGIRARSEAEVRAEAERMAQVWRADEVRLTPGAVAELRTVYAGRERVVYGRPRRFAANYADAAINNFVTVTADFACVDDLFYGADEQAIEFGLVPAGGGGLLAPLAAPLSTTLSSDRSQGIYVSTEMPAWPVIEIKGPITNPVVTIGERISFEVRVELAHDESIVIDTRPWRRTALRNGSINVAGAVRGTRLSKAGIPSGRYEVGLQGTDQTGTAAVRISWLTSSASL